MAIKTFKRHELKYQISPKQFEAMKTMLAEHMDLDKYCQQGSSYLIYNLYFDTENDDIIRRSISKPYYKEKLRMRSYTSPPTGEYPIFLELKKKIDGIVFKRRALLTASEAMDFIEKGTLPHPDNYLDKQVIEEIKDFLDRYPAKPKVFISYERTAFFDRTDPDFRVSFDKNIITRRDGLSLLGNDLGRELIDDDIYLMEIKLTNQIPLWLCEVLSQMKIFRTSFSKYGTEYMQFVKQKNTLNYDFLKRRIPA